MQAVASRDWPTVLSVVNDVTALGGVEAFNHDLAAELPKLGIKFRVLNLKPESNKSRKLPAWAMDYSARPWLRGPLSKLHAKRALQRVRPDWLMVHQPSALSFVMRTLPQNRLPIVSVVHNNSMRNEYWETQLRWRYQLAGYVAVSRTIHDRLTKQFGVTPKRVWTIPCGVSSAKNYPNGRPLPPQKSGHLSVLYVGRLASYAKQVFDLVGVVKELNQRQFPDSWKISLDIVGEGPDAKDLQKQLGDVIGRVKIQWHGRIPREELFKVYERTHIVLLLSSTEGMPIALREAMSHGAIPIVTDIPGHREIVTVGENGFLFPLGDLAQCARLCHKLAFDDTYEKISGNAASWTRDHTVEAVAEKYAALFVSQNPHAQAVAANREMVFD